MKMTVDLKLHYGAYRHCARLSAIFLLIVLLLGAGLAQASSVEGYWYGNGYQPLARKMMQWLTINRSDGSFTTEFREYNNCELVSVQIETGKWSISGNILTKKTLAVNGRPVSEIDYYTDTYTITELNVPQMRLVHEKTGQDWTLKRVDKDFTFPDCKNIS